MSELFAVPALNILDVRITNAIQIDKRSKCCTRSAFYIQPSNRAAVALLALVETKCIVSNP